MNWVDLTNVRLKKHWFIDMSYRERIGKELRRIREEKKLSLREVGAIAGITFQSVNKIESGKYSVTVDTLEKICNAIGAEFIIKKRESE